ncbi:MAG: hypothetical protein HOI03_00295 [Candidatus Marinimicrobia bacterium]|nr:hypothetical protein [Candidatus Neomarinimicrobiota bacterium]
MPKKNKKKKKIKNKKNYFTNFWNGDLSLLVSYWVFGVLISIGVGFSLVLFAILVGFPESIWGMLILPWTLFWAVGCWRSSDKYKGLTLWSVLAKISIVLSVIQGLASVVTGV